MNRAAKSISKPRRHMIRITTVSDAFPLIAQFSNSVGRTLRNAMLLSVTNLPKTILMAAMSAVFWLVLVFATDWFFRLAVLWVFGAFSVPAYFNSLLLKKIFKPFLDKKPAEE